MAPCSTRGCEPPPPRARAFLDRASLLERAAVARLPRPVADSEGSALPALVVVLVVALMATRQAVLGDRGDGVERAAFAPALRAHYQARAPASRASWHAPPPPCLYTHAHAPCSSSLLPPLPAPHARARAGHGRGARGRPTRASAAWREPARRPPPRRRRWRPSPRGAARKPSRTSAARVAVEPLRGKPISSRRLQRRRSGRRALLSPSVLVSSTLPRRAVPNGDRAARRRGGVHVRRGNRSATAREALVAAARDIQGADGARRSPRRGAREGRHLPRAHGVAACAAGRLSDRAATGARGTRAQERPLAAADARRGGRARAQRYPRRRRGQPWMAERGQPRSVQRAGEGAAPCAPCAAAH